MAQACPNEFEKKANHNCMELHMCGMCAVVFCVVFFFKNRNFKSIPPLDSEKPPLISFDKKNKMIESEINITSDV